MIVCGKFYGLICHKLIWHTEIGECKIKVLHVIPIKYAPGQNLVIIPDDAEKSTVSYMVLTCSKQHLHNTKREDLAESTGVVLAKYPPKVKLELLTILECQNWGKLCIP